VFVIESLPRGEYLTGERLVTRTLRPLAAGSEPFQVEYFPVNTARDLIAVMSAIAEMTRLHRLKPILHIEAHGDEDGVSMASGEHVPWDQLRTSLTEVNVASGLHMTLLMAMCKGWYVSKLLHPLHQAPAWAIIGPTVDVKAGEVADRTEAIYESLILYGTGSSFVSSLGLHAPNEERRFYMQLAERMFCEAYAAYFRGHTTPERLREREDEIVAEFVRKRGYTIEGASEARELARKHLSSDVDIFEKCKTKFFMFDIFPENRDRFTLHADDCGSLAAAGE
jgi:hypothetical protein